MTKRPDTIQTPGGEASGQKNDDKAYPIVKPKETGWQLNKDEADQKALAVKMARWERKAANPDEPDSEAEE